MSHIDTSSKDLSSKDLSSKDLSSKDLSSIELVRRAQCAEDEAQRRSYFAELVPRYQHMAYGYCLAILGDAQLAEDAVQEGFLTAYQQLAQLRLPQAFAVWLQRILFTHCRRLRRGARHATQALARASELHDGQPSPHAVVEQAELQQAVAASIAALPTSQQDPVALYYLDDYSQREIAEALQLTVDAVKKRLERARIQLAERMYEMAAEHLPATAESARRIPKSFATLMAIAASEGQCVLLETLLVEGMAIDEPDANGQTLLHWAAGAGNVEAVELILRYGANTTCRDHTGRTPYQLAVENRHTAVAKILRQVAPSA